MDILYLSVGKSWCVKIPNKLENKSPELNANRCFYYPLQDVVKV